MHMDLLMACTPQAGSSQHNTASSGWLHTEFQAPLQTPRRWMAAGTGTGARKELLRSRTGTTRTQLLALCSVLPEMTTSARE